MLYALGDGQWDIPALRALLEKIAPEHGELDGYEVRHAFPEIGERVMLLNARKVFYEGNNHSTILLAFEDITERRAAEREMQLLLEQKDLLLQEMQHRIANSLQIIASILLLKASTVQSEETRQHLQDAHKRVMSVDFWAEGCVPCRQLSRQLEQLMGEISPRSACRDSQCSPEP